MNSCNSVNKTAIQYIPFEVSSYNLLFTDVEINGKTYKTLIDFGDFSEIQLSTSLITELGVDTYKSDIKMSDINGNEYALETGVLKQIKIGNVIEDKLTFYSAKNEIETVSEQVGTDFQVVIGFGYFKSKRFTLDFIDNKIIFGKEELTKNDFSIPFDTEFGYPICTLHTKDGMILKFLFDTGTPISKISDDFQNGKFEDTIVNFQNFDFPTKHFYFSSEGKELSLIMESDNLQELKSLEVNAILGVNDMKNKKIGFNPLTNKITLSYK